MDFEKAKNSYRKNAFVQEQMAKRLICELIKNFGSEFDKVFEIGAGTGFLTDEIRARLNFKEIVLNDITDNFTNFSPNKFIKGDILKAETPEGFDLTLSNAVFQWIEDYNLLFKKLRSCVKKGGLLAFSCFGENNFIQIKDITGLGLNYPKLKEFIENSGFEIKYFEQELKTVCFKDVFDLLSHIKYTGVKTENKLWTKSDFVNFENQYLEKYKNSFGLELTYHPVYYILKAL